MSLHEIDTKITINLFVFKPFASKNPFYSSMRPTQSSRFSLNSVRKHFTTMLMFTSTWKITSQLWSNAQQLQFFRKYRRIFVYSQLTMEKNFTTAFNRRSGGLDKKTKKIPSLTFFNKFYIFAFLQIRFGKSFLEPKAVILLYFIPLR